MTPVQKANQLEIIFGDMAIVVVQQIIDSKPSEPREYPSTIGYWEDVMFLLSLPPNQSDKSNE